MGETASSCQGDEEQCWTTGDDHSSTEQRGKKKAVNGTSEIGGAHNKSIHDRTQ